MGLERVVDLQVLAGELVQVGPEPVRVVVELSLEVPEVDVPSIGGDTTGFVCQGVDLKEAVVSEGWTEQ